MLEMMKPYEERMDKAIAFLKSDFSTIRAGRANPAVLDKLMVDYYGMPSPINQLASVSVSEARVLVIQPYDSSLLKNIEKTIQASDLGINPINDGRVLRIIFPQLTEERRRDLVKQIRKMGEEGKVAIRAIRRDGIEKFKKDQKSSEITEDDLKNAEETMQKLTDDKCKAIDEVVKNKEKEIMEI